MKNCASAVNLRERSEHQPQRRPVKASTSPTGEVWMKNCASGASTSPTGEVWM